MLNSDIISGAIFLGQHWGNIIITPTSFNISFITIKSPGSQHGSNRDWDKPEDAPYHVEGENPANACYKWAPISPAEWMARLRSMLPFSSGLTKVITLDVKDVHTAPLNHLEWVIPAGV